ncbi:MULTISPECIES: aromatic amino acid ammonia-lyase [unclassified Bosea (in: a-proteobacteria)]|uniref:aromatic amino acid ammonia-lyase n=1 Tax=unclassified Bosea (in: a-proteobacteria) TaxID=2653178 RepID=UPI000F75AB67|nr:MULTISPECIES: aromatic amino acid ammonia-lyase [unclassified Bosea (in: a-proteobacteria)]AZO80351.1 hypothetical protein BLM15_24355 [Bosea sp. Tri-49]RXT23152.1 hypothetical protein B5U98_11145 [Bosea sp. Tri-39]RXT38623.1 hypothetical protein B5U99_10595 [Bosea sp. Tri-54]
MSHVDITGFDLTIDEIARVTRQKTPVSVTPDAVERMEAARVTTSVGAKTGVPLAPERIGEFNRRLLLTHNVAHGPLAPHEAVRAMMLVLLNSMASGRLGVRPLLAERLSEALNADRQIDVHIWGSMGQSDMAPITDLALALYGDIELQAGEALAMLNSSALALGIAALAMADLQRSLDLWSLIAALSMEGFAANPSIVSEAALRSRPFAGLERHGSRIRRYLDGSYILAKGGPRHLQDPLSFRSLPLLHGTAADSLDFAWRQVETEFRSSQNNPIVSLEDRSLVSVANFDTVSLSMALDIARLAFAPVVTGSAERVAKLVDSFWSGLTVGLIEEDGVGLPGFNGLAQFHKAITSEARLATAPVVQELASSSHSNGNLDRAGMAGLAARKTAEVASLCRSIATIELLVAAQAVDIRKATPLGVTTSKLHELVREVIPFAAAGDSVPHLDPLLLHIEGRNSDVQRMIELA